MHAHTCARAVRALISLKCTLTLVHVLCVHLLVLSARSHLCTCCAGILCAAIRVLQGATGKAKCKRKGKARRHCAREKCAGQLCAGLLCTEALRAGHSGMKVNANKNSKQTNTIIIVIIIVINNKNNNNNNNNKNKKHTHKHKYY
jgi:hypothetical protein